MIDGIIVIDKPRGWTSFDVVAKLRSLTKTKRVGHGGTLDPMATGVLVILFGKATKLSSKFLEGGKEYEGEMTLGITTDSYDADGSIVTSSAVDPSIGPAEAKNAFQKFIGNIEQMPPMFSAKKHKGQRLYELARKDIVVERKASSITIEKLDLMEFVPGINPKVRFFCKCSKGTYIRALAYDIGISLGCGAHLSGLRRVYSHPFRIEQAIGLEAAQQLIKEDKIDKMVIGCEELKA